MGVVWRAEDTILGRAVAIKFLPVETTPDEERRQMFLKEARLASSVSDARIVQVHELGREGGLDFIVMELVEGKPLTEILGGRALPVERVASIGEQVARALARAHQKQLLHRDIKPGNILVTSDGDVKVADFGLAALFRPPLSVAGSAVSTLTRDAGPDGGTSEEDRRVAGTLPYMSPEQMRGERLDGRSDIFSLGVVLYEMTTGRCPFVASSTTALAEEIRKARPQPVRDLVPGVPMELDRIVHKSLAGRPADRYQTMQDLAVDLKRLGRDLESGSAPSYKELQGIGRGRPRSRMVLLTTRGVLLALAAIGIGWLDSARRTASNLPRTILVLPLEVRGQTSGAAHVGLAFAEALAVSLAQSDRIKVLPVPTGSEVGAGGSLDRISSARYLGADLVLAGALTRDDRALRADLNLTDVSENRLIWGTSKEVADEDLTSLAESLIPELRQRLGVSQTFKYDVVSKPYGSTEFLGSAELVETFASNKQADPGRRLEATEKLVEAFPREPFAHLQRAVALWARSRGREALSAERQACEAGLARLSEADPDNPWDETIHAFLLDGDGRHSQAIERFSHLLARDDLASSLRSYCLNLRGQARSNSGQMKTALSDYQESLRLTPLNALSLKLLGTTLAAMGRVEEALTYMIRSIALAPADWEAENLLGDGLKRAGRVDDALPHFSKGCELGRKQKADACQDYGLNLAQIGRFAEAIPLLGDACAQERSQCASLAVALQLAGRLDDARRAAGKADAPPEISWSLYTLAQYHALAGHRAEAIRCLKRNLDIGGVDIWIEQDPWLESLHGDPAFEALVAETRRRIDS